MQLEQTDIPTLASGHIYSPYASFFKNVVS